MIFGKRALLALGIACAAGPFSHASKGGKNPPHSSKAHKEQNTPVFVTSAACAQKCMSAEFEPDNHLLTNAIQQCDAKSSNQQWEFLQVQDSTFHMLKSVGASADSTDGWCLGVVPQEDGGTGNKFNDPEDRNLDGEVIPSSFGFMGVTSALVFAADGWDGHDMCNHGKLALVPCGHSASQWYIAGSQLVSAYCWRLKYSSFLSVNEECTDLRLSMTTPASASAYGGKLMNSPAAAAAAAAAAKDVTRVYKAGITTAITELKDRTGSSSIAIKKHMQDNSLLGDGEKFDNTYFLQNLEDGVAAGTFTKVKGSYKLSASANTADGATAISRELTFMAVTQEFIETIPAPAAPTYSPTYMPTYGPTDGPL